MIQILLIKLKEGQNIVQEYLWILTILFFCIDSIAMSFATCEIVTTKLVNENDRVIA